MKQLIVILLLAFCVNINAQDNQFIEKLEELKLLMSEFDDGKYEYKQSISYHPQNPYEVSYLNSITTIKNGKTITEKIDFNLAFLENRLIKRKSSKKEMKLLLSSGKAKVLKVEIMDKASTFEKEFSIPCEHIDNIRDLEKMFKELIPLAQEYWKESINIPNDITEVIDQFSQYSGTLTNGKTDITQEFTQDDGYKDIVNFTLNKNEKGKTTSDKYSFITSDISPNSLIIGNESELISLSLATDKKQKLFTKEENGDLSYISNFKMFFKTPSEAYVAKELLLKAMDTGKTIATNRSEKHFNCTDCIQELKSNLSNHSIQNVLNGDCTAQLINEENENKITQSNFRWNDVDSRLIKIKYNKDHQLITLPIRDKKRYITSSIDGNFDKFINAATLKTQNIEGARAIVNLLPQITENCKEDIVPKSFDWLVDMIAGIELEEGQYTYSLESTDDDCSYIYTVNDNAKEKENQYEFNLYDIDQKVLTANISSSTAAINIKSNNNDKIITTYDSKGTLEYINKFELRLKDPFEARTAVLTLKRAIEVCNDKN